MSSNYRILCVSHDPAIILEPEEQAPDLIIGRVRRGLPDHPNCDLLVGRYSYPLIKVCCAGNDVPQLIPHAHRDPVWVEAGFLRVMLLALKYAPTDHSMQAALQQVPSCWAGHRLQSLRAELGVTP